jgi:two-component system, OmpR family, sensor kinase
MTAAAPAPGPLGHLSLRGRVVAITLLLVVAALLASNALLVTLLERQLVHQLDDRLRAAATAAAASAAPAQAAVRDAPAGDVPAGEVYVARLDTDGRVWHPLRTESDAPRLPVLGRAEIAARAGRPFQVAAARGGDEWRVVAVPRPASRGFGPDGSVPTGVVAAGTLAPVHSTVRHLGMWMLVIDSLVLVLLGVVAWFAVRAGLRPLWRVERTAAAIAGGDLSSRVPQAASTGTELGRLAAALNGMLDRIEAGDAARAATHARMRTFLADASHELRTPLFGIKGFTELYRMGGMPQRRDVDSAMGRIEREAARLVKIVEDLLLLARLDEEGAAEARLPVQLTPMDLRTLAVDALHDLRALDPGRPVTLTGPDGGPPGRAPVLGDEARLRQVTANLVGNAIAHTPPGTPVRIGVGMCDDLAVLELSDAGPGMAAEQAAHAFDRFSRVDNARGRTRTGGTGLGLAITRSLVHAHRGRIDVDTAPGRGATFRIRLPPHADGTGSGA